MRKQKAVLSLLLSITLLVSCAAGCGGQENPDPSLSPNAATEAPVSTAEPSSAPAVSDAPEASDTGAPETAPDETPEPTPADEPEPTPTEMPGPIIAVVVPEPIVDVPTTGPLYQKIHFTLDNTSHGTIDNWEDLYLAIQDLRLHAVEAGFLDEYQITVEFASDFLNTERYQALEEERDTLESEEEIQDWEERSTAWSREYHSNLVAENLGVLSPLHYESATPVDCAPDVVLTMDILNITQDALALTASSDVIVSLTVATHEPEIPV